jgi:hypothetical protein
VIRAVRLTRKVLPQIGPRVSLLVVCATWGLVLGALGSGCARQREGQASIVERQGKHGERPYRLQSEIRPGRVTLGDPVLWRLKAELPAGASPGTPIAGRIDSSLDVVPMGAPRESRRASGSSWSWPIRIRAFDLGRIALPRISLPIGWPDGIDTLRFPQDTLTVDSLTSAMSGTIEPDRGPVPTELRPVDRLVLALGVAALLLAVAALILAVRARRRRIAAAAVPVAPESPETILLRELEALRSALDSIPRDQFYDRLSVAVRTYVASITGVPALDRTTTELLRELSSRAELDPEGLGALGRALRRSDLARFARREDALAEARLALDDARQLGGGLVRRALVPEGT